jgi:protein-L-isoaspartate(D-aspartate) O-methyltransferase
MKTTLSTFLVVVFLWSTMAEADPIEPREFYQARHTMVHEQIERRGVTDPRVLKAMREVPRHLFVPPTLKSTAYSDRPLAIGEGQTISQPYIVALMTESLSLKPTSRVLEIGTGSGYQAAILAATAGEVYTIEIKKRLFEQADRTLRSLKLENVHTRLADGYYGWNSEERFDAMMITAAVDHIPPPLLRQLKDGGRLVLPLGNPFSYQNLVLVTKNGQDFTVKQITGVLFVPMTGHALDRAK